MRILYALCSMLLMARFAYADMTAQEKIDTLAAHNRYRAEVKPTAANMLRMQWSNALEKTAQDYANTCNFNHNAARTTQTRTNGGNFNYVGENLYIGSGARTGMTATLSWNNENSSYTYSTGACSGVCGHYTQNVWANSGFLGCASAFCNTATGVSFNCANFGGCTIVVCNYAEGGNYVGQKPYVQGTPCSACPSSAPNCVNGALCTASAGTGPSPTPAPTNPPATTPAPTNPPANTPAPTTSDPVPSPSDTPAPAPSTPTPAPARRCRRWWCQGAFIGTAVAGGTVGAGAVAGFVIYKRKKRTQAPTHIGLTNEDSTNMKARFL